MQWNQKGRKGATYIQLWNKLPCLWRGEQVVWTLAAQIQSGLSASWLSSLQATWQASQLGHGNYFYLSSMLTPIHILHFHWSYNPCIYSVETPFFPSEKLSTNMRCSIRNAVETEPEQQMLKFGIRAMWIGILSLPRKWNNLCFLKIPVRIAWGLILDTLRLLTTGFLFLCVWVTQHCCHPFPGLFCFVGGGGFVNDQCIFWPPGNILVP